MLDEESPADHALGDEILEHFRKHSSGLVEKQQVRVEFEPLPKCHDQGLFVGGLEGNAGKDRSQRSNFLFDRYARSPIVAMFDAEVCFVAPVTPDYFARRTFQHSPQEEEEEEESEGEVVVVAKGQEGKLRKRLQVLATTGDNNDGTGAMLSGDHWGVDSWALGHDTPLEVMWLNSFPMLFWRDDLEKARRHLVNRFSANNLTLAIPLSSSSSSSSTSSPPPSSPPPSSMSSSSSSSTCAFETPFDAAFSRISGAEKMWGYEHRRFGFSQFNILANFVFRANPAGYTFHLVKSNPSTLKALVDNHLRCRC